jgi:hypothetical protein
MRFLFALFLAMLPPSATQELSTAEPPLPYEDPGACPFECCTYRTWTVEVETDILTDRKDDAPVAFRLRPREKVEGVTGVVVTTKLGRAVVRRTITIGSGSDPVEVKPGDQVFILHYVGEGYWRFWVRGRIDDDQLPDTESECTDDSAEPADCAIQITERPETTWWAKIRSGDREGWTRQLDHFGDIDACS